ncbi:hypothetical protein [Pseudarthrobacter sp. NPDC058119]|uniref:hypothetical protein n=1 Tax=Pseudarthrobacter sp. NPDC058119 TaxID=3346348 RepID=UPI0036D8908C
MPKPTDWMTSANAASFQALRGEVRNAWMGSRKGIRAKFFAGDVVGHAGPAYAILRAGMALNEAVISVSNRMLEIPFRRIDDSVRDRLGMWLVPLAPGSIVLDLVCPPALSQEEDEAIDGRPGQTSFVELADAGLLGPRAIDEVFDVLHALVRAEWGNTQQLEGELRRVGVQATRQLDKFAARCVEMGSSVQLDDRLGGDRRAVLTTEDSKLLRRTVRSLELDTEEVVYRGTWLTASFKRHVFDLVTTSGDSIFGSVPREMAAISKEALQKFVEITVKETAREGFEETSVKRVLSNLVILDDDQPEITS